MEDKIKKQIEEEALRRFPDNRIGFDELRIERIVWTNGAEYGYSIKESVNERVLERFKDACLTVIRGYEDDELENMSARDDVFYDECREAISFAIEKTKEIDFSASNKSKKESVNEKLVEALRELVHLHNCEMEGLEIGQPTAKMWYDAIEKANNALLSSSNQENNEGEKCNCAEEYVCGICFERKGYAVKDGKLEFINPPKEK